MVSWRSQGEEEIPYEGGCHVKDMDSHVCCVKVQDPVIVTMMLKTAERHYRHRWGQVAF